MDSVMNALVVDGDQLVRDAMKTVLEGDGFTVAIAGNGQEALLSMQGFRPDIVITDIVMPEMDGLELIRWVRRELRLDVPIMVVSGGDGHLRDVYLKCAKKMGANAILSKPLSRERLLGSVRSLLADHREAA